MIAIRRLFKTDFYSMKWWVLVGLQVVFLFNGQAQNAVQTAIDVFSADPEFKNASISIKVIDCATGEVIGQKNPSLSLSPASTTKLFATATAFELLGKDYAPVTKIYAEGKIVDSVLKGNLWIRGAGDISLGSRYYNGDGLEDQFLKNWSDSLRSRGIKKIEGKIIADGSEFRYEGAPDGWNWGDMGNYYGAAGAGCSIYDNMMRYYFYTGKSAGAATTFAGTFPNLPGFVFHNYITTGGGGDNSYIYGAPYAYDRFGTGTLGRSTGRYTVRGSLPDPEWTMAQEMKRVLTERGIVVTDTAIGARSLPFEQASVRYPGKTMLLSHKGKTVESIAWWTNMKSVNTFAEELLMWVGYGKTGNGSIDNSIDVLNAHWRTKFSTEGLYIKDGSGLSRSNAISADHFCALLKYMTTAPTFLNFYKTLPIAGVSGTLSDVCSNQAAENRVHAKSGTMKRIKSYAGYVETKSGKRLAFAIVINNFNCSSDATVTRMEKIMNSMALY